jgi:hypothetical protein
VTSASDFVSCSALPLSLSLPSDQLQGMISDESSPCSSTNSSETSNDISGGSSGCSDGSSDKTDRTVILEDGSDSSNGGQEPGPEKYVTFVCVCTYIVCACMLVYWVGKGQKDPMCT